MNVSASGTVLRWNMLERRVSSLTISRIAEPNSPSMQDSQCSKLSKRYSREKMSISGTPMAVMKPGEETTISAAPMVSFSTSSDSFSPSVPL